MESIWIGTDLKIKVELTCSGFTMADDYFTITATWGNGCKREYAKSELATDGSDYYLMLPTANMSGTVALVATLYVPDTDFESGLRKEVIKENLFKVKPV